MTSDLMKVMHYYSLLEDSATYKIICPFHEDVNPSMMINLENNSFFCFGCNVSGDAFKFVKLMNKNLDDLKAYIKYYRILRSRKTISLKTKMVIKHVDSQQATIEAADYYNGLSLTDWSKDNSEIKEYMKKRGFDERSLTLAKAKINYNNSYPIIFPMFDNDKFRGWVCRTNNKDVEKKRKYLYNTGFSRRDTLVGSYQASTVIIVEGYMDWLKLKQFGVKNAVAILGWKMTAHQITKLKEAGVKTIISALDNDDCGKRGTKYLKSFFNVIQFYFPRNIKDPGEMDQATFKKCKTKTIRKMEENNNGTR